MSILELRSFELERAERLASRQNDNGNVEREFLKLIENYFNPQDVARIKEGLDFAKAQNYHHKGLTSAEYLIHPTRVATLAVKLVKPLSVDVVLLGLLHNAFELTDLKVGEVAGKFGSNIALCAKTLTVDRSRQDDEAYKKWFYDEISSLNDAGIIKVLDKLDNLFVLGLNPSEETRAGYIKEIRKNLLPLAEKHLPNVRDYILDLTFDCEKIGFIKT